MKIFKLQFFLEYDGDYEMVFASNLATKEIFEADVKKIANSYIDSVMAAKKFTVNLHLMYNAICEELLKLGYIQYEIDTIKIHDQDLEFAENVDNVKRIKNTCLAKFCPDKLDAIVDYNKEFYFSYKDKFAKLFSLKEELQHIVYDQLADKLISDKYKYCLWKEETLLRYVDIYLILMDFYGDERFRLAILEELNEILDQEKAPEFVNDKDREECYRAIEFLLNTKND